SADWTYRRPAAEGARGREWPAETDAGRRHARQRGAEGPPGQKVVTPAARREAAMQLRQAFQMSERRACLVLGTDRASVRYRAIRPDDGALRERLKALAQQRRRFGYRRLYVLLRREGELVNKKRVQRLYREERLSVRRRGGRKRAMGTRRPIEVPQAANQRWSLDFIHDQLTDGRRFRILAIVDDCTRECLTHARAVLQAWRRDYNEARPHSKLGWMTPRDYARAIGGDAGRGAALRHGSAPRPLATSQTQGSNQPRTLLMPG